MTVEELLLDLQNLDKGEKIVVVVDEDADIDPDDDPIEAGSILEIKEAGGWDQRLQCRTIRVEPR